ncbi:MAG: peptidylprolyl isomerase [Vicinamibacterales bacterium]|nr:peptidylprolyl isomerase [Vicinamibacterales bacterium]
MRAAPFRRPATVALTLVALGCTVLTAQPPLRDRLLTVEDARDASNAGMAVLREGLASRDPALRRRAARAVGRFERPDFLASIVPLLADADARVRQEAANAAGQLATTPESILDVHTRLRRRLQAEQDPDTWGVVAATLGRLRYERSEHVSAAEDALRRVLPVADTTDPVRAGEAAAVQRIQPGAVTGAVKGFEALVRQSRRLLPPASETVDRLRAAALLGRDGAADDRIIRIRRLAWTTLTSAGEVDAGLVDAAFDDPDGEVRRIAMVAVSGEGEFAGRARLLARGLADPHAPVRDEALRGWGRHLQRSDCQPVLRAIDDPNGHVALQAIDLAGNGCPDAAPQTPRLRTLADGLSSAPGAWHRAAHAIVALARTAPAEAAPLLPRFAAHGTWQVRMYAARAAGTLGDGDVLLMLARDAHDNVREAALGQLVEIRHPDAVRVAIDALSRPDYQLVQTAARALHDRARRAETLPALLAALARLTAEQRDTSRDPRTAILEAVKQLGWPDGAGITPAQIDTIRAYASDADREVASRAADLVQTWTKAPQASQPRHRPMPYVPVAEIDALAGVRARVTMAGRGVFEVRFLVEEAPFTVHRVVTLARRGYYDGLTFHRVVPNFVIQGGSPGANEYVGDGPYMRDEVGLRSHRRGTLGISTRGRDTGDAQIFVNLVDLPRLDHAYTVFAEVTSGMDVIDAILEGDVMERFEILP